MTTIRTLLIKQLVLIIASYAPYAASLNESQKNDLYDFQVCADILQHPGSPRIIHPKKLMDCEVN